MEASTEASAPSTASTPLFSIIISSIVTMECIAGILLNPLTIAAIVIGGLGKNSATNLFIASLSISDFLSGLTIFCFQVQRWVATLSGVQPSLAALSWISATISAIAFPGSLVSAMVIGIDRAVATSKPLSYKNVMSPHNGKYILALLWALLSCVVFIPVIYKYVTLDSVQRNQLIVNPPDVYPDGYTTYFTSPLVYVFLITNSLLYAKVFVSYKQATRKIRSKNMESADIKSRKLTQTALIVNTILVICWTPLAVVSALPPPNPETQPKSFLAYVISYESVFIFLLLPAFLNNIIYALQHKDYKIAYMNILGIKHNEVTSHVSRNTRSTNM